MYVRRGAALPSTVSLQPGQSVTDVATRALARASTKSSSLCPAYLVTSTVASPFSASPAEVPSTTPSAEKSVSVISRSRWLAGANSVKIRRGTNARGSAFGFSRSRPPASSARTFQPAGTAPPGRVKT